MKFDLWVSPPGRSVDPDGDMKEYVRRFGGIAALSDTVEHLLKDGRSVEIVPVAAYAPPTGEEERPAGAISSRELLERTAGAAGAIADHPGRGA